MDLLTCGLRFKIVEQRLFLCSGLYLMGSNGLLPEEPLSENLGGKNADELCNLVFTTSNGHVTIAPTVPATL